MLLVELKRIRSSGVGVDNEELLEGMTAVAVPVFNSEGEACFTVAVHAPTARKPLVELKSHIPDLQDAARKMEENYCRAEAES